MEIRQITSADRREILAFTEKTFEWGDYISDVFDDWLKEGLFLAAEMDGEVVGIMHASYLDDGSAWFEGGRIHPEHRRQGIATALAVAALDRITQDKIRTGVEEQNIASGNLLKKAGAIPVMDYSIYEVPCMDGESGAKKAGMDDVKTLIDDAKRHDQSWLYSPWKSWQRFAEKALIGVIDRVYQTKNGLAVVNDLGDRLSLAPQFFDSDALWDFLLMASHVARESGGKVVELHIPIESSDLIEGKGFLHITDLMIYEIDRGYIQNLSHLAKLKGSGP